MGIWQTIRSSSIKLLCNLSLNEEKEGNIKAVQLRRASDQRAEHVGASADAFYFLTFGCS